MDRQQAALISQVEQGILQVAAAEERKLDEKLKSLENLGKSIDTYSDVLKLF